MKLGLLLVGLFLLAPASALADQVVSVGDGDTLRVTRGGKTVTVRLACIDAPETTQQPYGSQSRAALQRLAPVGSNVSLRVRTTDRYGRTVAEVIRGGTNVNLAMVREGQAFVYWQYISGCDRNGYSDAERSAQGRRLGVWSVTGGITRPWDWRRQKRGGGGASTSPPAAGSPAPARVQHRQTCKSIGSWAKAQELLRQGHTYLDWDGDGEACEGLR